MPGDAWAPGYKSSAQHINTGLAPTLQPQDQTARCLLPVSYTHLTLPTKRIV